MVKQKVPHAICPECGADNNTFSASCWMCHASFSDGEEWVEAVALEPPAFARKANYVVSRITFFILILGLVVVGVGIGLLNPGILIPYVLFACVPMIAIGVAVRRGMTSTNTTTATVSSAFAYLFLAILLAVAALIGLFVLCIAMMPTNFH